jgi:hypothetical protein
MKKINLLFILNVWSLLIIAQSPITLGNSNMPGNGDTLRYTNVQLSSLGNYTQTGVNFAWNFGSLVSTTEGLRNFKSALQTPYAFFFLNINDYGEKISDTIGAGPLTLTNYYNFYKKQSSPVNAFIADGVGMTYSSLPVPSYYSDKDELYNFPMTYPKYDSTTFKFSTSISSLLPITYSKVGYRVTRVDGWGTITTPYGTDNCLRLVTTQYATDSTVTALLPLGLGFPNYQRSYQWLTSTSKIPYFEITGNLVGTNFTITQARYRGYNKQEATTTGIEEHKNEIDVSLYPNPVKERLWLSGLRSNSSLEIYSLDGKLVWRAGAEFSVKQRYADVGGLDAGIYLVKISTDQKESYLKFVKE